MIVLSKSLFTLLSLTQPKNKSNELPPKQYNKAKTTESERGVRKDKREKETQGTPEKAAKRRKRK